MEDGSQNLKVETSSPTPSISSIKLGYHYAVSYTLKLLPAALFVLTASKFQYSTLKFDDILQLCYDFVSQRSHTLTYVATPLIVALLVLYFFSRPRPIYLVNFSCAKPDGIAPAYTREYFIESVIKLKYFNDESVEFQKKILERSGIGNNTYFPLAASSFPPTETLQASRMEVEMVMFGAVDSLLAKTGIKASEIDLLVVNCSLFCPTPSLSEIIINKYELREDVICYSLSGMGCSAGLLSVDLARNVLKVHRNSRALIVSTESLTLNGYKGNNRAMLVTNCLFRVGGAAVLLSNHPADRRRAKYRLVNLVRTHKGADDESYNCVSQEEDDVGRVGIRLSKDLMNVAGEALKTNITKLGPLVLPISEQLFFAATIFAKKVLMVKIPAYVPDFKMAFNHFCIHAGGRALLDAIEKSLKLTPWHMEPSRMTLYRFGNTSSSSLWYELAYSEAKGRIKKGDSVWQLGLGSGFKCNSLVWKANRNVDPEEDRIPWSDEIHQFPVPVPKVMPIDVCLHDANGKEHQAS